MAPSWQMFYVLCLLQSFTVVRGAFRGGGSVTGEVKNDPLLINLMGQHARFPYSCRFQVNMFNTTLRSILGTDVGTCSFEISSFIAKHKGKFYVHGIDLAIRLYFRSRQTVVTRSARVYGVQHNGVDEVEIKSSHDFEPDGTSGNENFDYINFPTGTRLRLAHDPSNHLYTMKARRCGVEVTYVPYDDVLGRDSDFTPGMSVCIELHNDPEFSPSDASMTLSPILGWSDIQVGKLDYKGSVLIRAFRSGVPQTQPLGCAECTRAHTIYSSCSDSQLEAASPACDWMLDEPRFIRCIDQTVTAQFILRLRNDCVESFCGGPKTCSDVISDITTAGCHTLSDPPAKLSSFLSGVLCS